VTFWRDGAGMLNSGETLVSQASWLMTVNFFTAKNGGAQGSAVHAGAILRHHPVATESTPQPNGGTCAMSIGFAT
jgi:hypothetical protein